LHPGYRHLMHDTPQTHTAEQDVPQEEREERRPDLTAAPESPPVEEIDLERGREKLDRVIAK
jgi:hypothetical protein